MTNVQTFYNTTTLLPYLPDEVEPAVNALLQFIPKDVKMSDGLTLYVNGAMSATKVEVSDTAGKRPLLMIAQSQGEAGYISIWDLDSDDVTVGTTDQHVVMPVGATSGEVSVMLLVGAGVKTVFDTGLTIACATTARGNTALTAANRPKVWLLYA